MTTPSLFGPRVIGKEAFEKQRQMIDEGRVHFGPRVIGYPEGAHGKTIVGKEQAAVQEVVAEVTGAPAAKVEDLKRAQLHAICDKLGIKYHPVRDSNEKLAERIKARYAEVGAVPPPELSGAAGPSTKEADLTPDELVAASLEELPTLLAEVTDPIVIELAFGDDDRQDALEMYANRAKELGEAPKKGRKKKG